jgi:hypothetical protein
MRRIMITAAALLALAGCGTPNPVVNAEGGGLGGAAVGCGIGAAVTAPLLGIGCIPGAIIGGASGATLGAASTPLYVPPPPQVSAWPAPQYSPPSSYTPPPVYRPYAPEAYYR